MCTAPNIYALFGGNSPYWARSLEMGTVECFVWVTGVEERTAES